MSLYTRSEVGWGVHVVQEVKLLTGKTDRQALDALIDNLETTEKHVKLNGYESFVVALEAIGIATRFDPEGSYTQLALEKSS